MSDNPPQKANSDRISPSGWPIAGALLGAFTAYVISHPYSKIISVSTILIVGIAGALLANEAEYRYLIWKHGFEGSESSEAGSEEEIKSKSVNDTTESSATSRKQSEKKSDIKSSNPASESFEPKITVVGCGSAGGSAVTRMMEEGIHGVKFVAADTKTQHLISTAADTKILMGKEKTQGRGAGSLPQVGEEAAIESQEEIKDAIAGSDMVFVTAGLGGGTGTGSAPVVAKAAQAAGALTISVVTTPFTAEGEVRNTNAEAGLERLQDVSDAVIVVPNDRLLDAVGKLPVKKAFEVSDEVLMRSVKRITELITKPSVVNLDFADVRRMMEGGGVATIGFGESDSENKAWDSVQSALKSPLLDDISEAKNALVNVVGGSDMSIEEAEGVVEEIYEHMGPDARIIWGTSVDEEFEGMVETMIVATGVGPANIDRQGEVQDAKDHIHDLGDDVDYAE